MLKLEHGTHKGTVQNDWCNFTVHVDESVWQAALLQCETCNSAKYMHAAAQHT